MINTKINKFFNLFFIKKLFLNIYNKLFLIIINIYKYYFLYNLNYKFENNIK